MTKTLAQAYYVMSHQEEFSELAVKIAQDIINSFKEV
jgi:hypothetical protein